ncbi:MAG: YbaB/EbfC family nucleoid-associated protein [Bacilli bacterium]|nr:YbaB/EbfC family nucleoid-associated protein [Bacilli bacterium]
MNMQSIMAQAQKMQRDITNKKEEINKMTFVGESELVNVTMNGKKEVLKVEIKGEIDNSDKEMLEDMILLATNKAISLIDKEVEKQLGQYSSALNGLM